MSNCASYLSEIHRVLTPKGVFICVSYGTPENREIYLKKVRYIFLLNINVLIQEEFDWTVTVDTVFKPYTTSTISIDHEDKD